MTKFKLKQSLKANKLLTIFSTFFVVAFILLGVWQVERAANKLDLLNAFDLEQKSPPNRLSASSKDWRRVFVDGIFDVSNQILIDNQIHNGKWDIKFLPHLSIMIVRGYW